jgi:hypothetical protein
MLEVGDGIVGDHMRLEHLELPPGLVVRVLVVEEQHLHLGEVLPGHWHLVELLRINAVQVIAYVGPLGRSEHGLGVGQTCLMQTLNQIFAVAREHCIVLLDEFHGPSIIEAMDMLPWGERHRANVQEIYEAEAATQGHRRLGVVIVLSGNVPQCQTGLDLRVPEEPNRTVKGRCLHLRGTGQPVVRLGHLVFLVFSLHVFMFNIIRISKVFIYSSISSDVVRCSGRMNLVKHKCSRRKHPSTM